VEAASPLSAVRGDFPREPSRMVYDSPAWRTTSVTWRALATAAVDPG